MADRGQNIKFKLKEVSSRTVSVSAYNLDVRKSEYVELLNTTAPDYLYGYASSYTTFAELIEQQGLQKSSPFRGWFHRGKLHDHHGNTGTGFLSSGSK
jgi:hypothetical protein